MLEEKVTSPLTLRAPATVSVGTRATVTGTLYRGRSAWAGHTVVLAKKTSTGWMTLASTKASCYGQFPFTLTVKRGATVRVRAHGNVTTVPAVGVASIPTS
jgi:hypothetical protein